MTTLHADGIDRVPARLIALGMLAGLDAHTLTMLAEGAFDVMLHLSGIMVAGESLRSGASACATECCPATWWRCGTVRAP